MFLGLFGALVPEHAAAEVGYSVRISASQSRGTAPFDVQFSLLAETRPTGEIARVEVDPGDGSGVILAHTGRGWIRSSPKHRYTRPGRFTARITLITTDGQRATSRARITVVPEKPANPAELLVVVNARGDAPHTATFKIGGDSLPFTARAARLSFGDGQASRVMPFQTLTHIASRAAIWPGWNFAAIMAIARARRGWYPSMTSHACALPWHPLQARLRSKSRCARIFGGLN